jgi:hypothetical protein
MKPALYIWLALAVLLQAAGLEFESLTQEVHAPADASVVTADFNFTNKSDKPVTITNSDPGCSCLSVQVSGGKLKYAPGESGMLRATFEMGNFSGTVDKVIALWIDNDPADKPSMALTVQVHIPVLVTLEPKTLRWDLHGKSEPKVIEIRMTEDKPIKVLGIKPSTPAFRCELKVLEEGRKYDLVVTPLSVDQSALCVIRIETDCKIARHRIQQAFAVVAKPPQPVSVKKP